MTDINTTRVRSFAGLAQHVQYTLSGLLREGAQPEYVLGSPARVRVREPDAGVLDALFKYVVMSRAV